MGSRSPKSVFTAVSLFSGAMGLDIGLEKTGRIKVLACVENDVNCLATIALNRDAGRLASRDVKLYGDITQISPAGLMSELGLQAGDIDLLVGGPPCQTFSTVGGRSTIQDARGTRLWDFFRFVRELRPRFFLMENVRGLLSAALRHRPIAERDATHPPLHADEKPGSVVRLLLSDYEKEGYRVDVCEVNAVNYGAPQLRERALFIGNSFDLAVSFPEPTHVSHEVYEKGNHQGNLFQPQNALMPFATLGDAIGGFEEEEPVVMDFSPRKKSYLSLVPPGANWRSLPEHLQRESMGRAFHAKGGRSGWWRRLSYDLPCPCLVTMPNHASTSLCHPAEVRALSVGEYAKIQEFPDDWEFIGTPADRYRQIGNAVPIRLGVVAGELLASLLDNVREIGKEQLSAGDAVTPSRVVYVKSHVRTRRWYKDSQAIVNGNAATREESRQIA